MRKSFTLLSLLLLTISIFAQKPVRVALDYFNPQNSYAIIIGNENYQDYNKAYTEDVVHAIYDAELFMNFLIKSGFQEDKMYYYPDATSTHIKLALNRIGRLSEESGTKANVVFYFNGKMGKTQMDEYYMLPIDATEQDNVLFSFTFDELLKRLDKNNVEKATIYLDATPDKRGKGESLLETGGKPLEVAPGYASMAKAYIATAAGEDIALTIARQRLQEQQSILASVSTDETVEEKPIIRPTAGRDTKPPVLKVLEPTTTTINTQQNVVHFIGQATDESGIYQVVVNGEESHIAVDGTFKATVALEEGENVIEVEAIDGFRNHTLLRYTAVFSIPEIAPLVERKPAKFYALVFAVNQYADDNIPDLRGPIDDSEKLVGILTASYGFDSENVTFLKNPKRKQILASLDEVRAKLTENDNLLIFFSGHGTWDESTKMGYWLPSDAFLMGRANYIKNSEITGFVSDLPTKHTLVIADACFSGSIFRTRGLPPEVPPDVEELLAKPSRKAMTAGDLNEVPDDSQFFKYLSKGLSKNSEAYLPSRKLYDELKAQVIKSTNNIPQFGDLKNCGDQGGDFVFIRQ